MKDLKKLHATLNDLTTAINKAFQTPSLPAFILLYASIDILSSLQRSMNQSEVHQEDFKDWVTKYMIAGKTVDWNAEDIYGARCGLLHTYSMESTSSKKTRKAKPLVFISNDPNFFIAGQDNLEPHNRKLVELDEFLKSFSDGVKNFEAAIENNPVLREMVSYHAKSLAFHATISCPPG